MSLLQPLAMPLLGPQRPRLSSILQQVKNEGILNMALPKPLFGRMVVLVKRQLTCDPSDALTVCMEHTGTFASSPMHKPSLNADSGYPLDFLTLLTCQTPVLKRYGIRDKCEAHLLRSHSCTCNAGPAREGVAGEARGIDALASHDLQQLDYTNAGPTSLRQLT